MRTRETLLFSSRSSVSALFLPLSFAFLLLRLFFRHFSSAAALVFPFFFPVCPALSHQHGQNSVGSHASLRVFPHVLFYQNSVPKRDAAICLQVRCSAVQRIALELIQNIQ